MSTARFGRESRHQFSCRYSGKSWLKESVLARSGRTLSQFKMCFCWFIFVIVSSQGGNRLRSWMDSRQSEKQSATPDPTPRHNVDLSGTVHAGNVGVSDALLCRVAPWIKACTNLSAGNPGVESRYSYQTTAWSLEARLFTSYSNGKMGKTSESWYSSEKIIKWRTQTRTGRVSRTDDLKQRGHKI